MNGAKIDKKTELENKRLKLANFYTNAGYLTLDVAYTFICDCDIILNQLHKQFSKAEKNRVKNALMLAEKLRRAVKEILAPYKDVLCTSMATDNSDYLYSVVKLIFDRTSDTAEGKDLVLNMLKEMPSVLCMEEELYVDYTADLEDVGETDLQKQMNRMQSEYNKIANKYREALSNAKQVALSRLLLEQYENKRIEVEFSDNLLNKKEVGYYGGCKIIDGSNSIYMMLYGITKDGSPSRRSPRNINVTNIKAITII